MSINNEKNTINKGQSKKKMKKNILILTLALLIISLSACTTKNAGDETKSKNEVEQTTVESREKDAEHYPVTVSIRTQEGNVLEQTFTEAPKKIVSVGLNMTELLIELGLDDKIIGVTNVNDIVTERLKDKFSKLNIISESWPNKEVMLTQNADLICGWAGAFWDERLGAINEWNTRGVNAFTLTNITKIDKVTLDNHFSDIETIGKIFNIEDKTTDYIEAKKAQIQKIQNVISTSQDKPNVLFLLKFEDDVYNNYPAASTIASELVDIAGGKYISMSDTFVEVNLESIIEKNPDVILIATYGYTQEQLEKLNPAKALINQTSLANVKAVKDNKVISVPYTDLVFGGVSTIDEIERIAKVVHPELFEGK